MLQVLSMHLCHSQKLRLGYNVTTDFTFPNRNMLHINHQSQVWILGSQQERQPRTGSLVVGQSTYQLTPGIAAPTGCFLSDFDGRVYRGAKIKSSFFEYSSLNSSKHHGSRKRVSPKSIISLYNTIAFLFHKYGLNRTSWYVEWRIEGFTTKKIKTQSSKICLQENSFQILSQFFAFSRLGLASGLGWFGALQ